MATGSIPPAAYQADIAIPPGETIRETLDALGMSQSQLAERMNRPANKINEIVKGGKQITVETAIGLERVLGLPANFWLNLEKNYRLTLARLEENARFADDVEWLETIPIKELVRRGCLKRTNDKAAMLAQVLTFFGVSSVQAWRDFWAKQVVPAVDFRRTEKQARHVGRAATWLRLGEIVAQSSVCRPFQKGTFQAALKGIRQLTVAQPEVFEPAMKKLCADAGVVVALVKEIPGAGISGATRWLAKDKALIQLSLRYKSDDQFWFTFFHESGHILLHGKTEVFLEDGNRSEKDAEADRFAADFLIPPADAARLPRLRTKQEIRAFAKLLDIAPGIVVGRLQHDGHLTPQKANYLKLKRRLEWAENA